ncbi:hypothetical protein ABPG74_008138 [Tetrahymena malaccensis]
MERELFCAYHVGQNITNFCEDSQCLMPLCPKCLPIHTSEHKQNKTYGSFQPIDDMILRATQISKLKIDSYKQILAKNERSSLSGSEFQTNLIKQLKEAKEKVIFEIETFFSSLESKCQKICSELTNKKSSNLKNETFDVEKKIRQYQEFLDGIQKKEKCLMSLIRIFKANQEEQQANNIESLSQLNSNTNITSNDLNKIQIKVDLEKLSEITDNLSGYVKLAYNYQQKVAKKQVKFDENSLSNKSVNSSQDISPLVFESPNSKLKNDNKTKQIKRNTNNVYDKDQELEEESDANSDNSSNNLQEKYQQQQQQQQNKQKGFYKDADDIYLINDPDIIRLKQKQEERRIKNELREIGMKKITSNSNIPQSSKVRRPPNSIEDKMEEFKEPSNNFVTFQRPSKDQLKQYAKPEELEFLEKAQQKSIQLQQEFEKQQNDIFQSAINYQIPIPQRNIYQPRQFPEQKQQQFNSQQELQPLPTIFKSQSASQSEADITSPSRRQILQNQYTNQQQILQRSPLADRFDQNSLNRQPLDYMNYDNNFNRVQSPYSLKSQNVNSPNAKLVKNPINVDIQSNGYQAQQQWNNQKMFYN